MKVARLLLVAGMLAGTSGYPERQLDDNLLGTLPSTCSIFPDNHVWNTPIDCLPVHANSATFVQTIGGTTGLKADFGSGLWNGGPIGIPFTTVDGAQTKYPATFDYADESDAGPYAVPLNAPIEGGSNANGDRHAIAVDTTNCILYELYYAFPNSNSWDAGSGAIFDLNGYSSRPAGWTSADAAGLPIFPGLVRYEEIEKGEIRHAIRFTVPQTRKDYVWPARHYASSLTDAKYPPMGLRFRLKESFDISGFSSTNQIILTAMKKYGIILSDNGSSWFMSGVPSASWDDDDLQLLRNVKGNSLEAVDTSSLIVDSNSGQANQICNESPAAPPTPGSSGTAAPAPPTPGSSGTAAPSPSAVNESPLAPPTPGSAGGPLCFSGETIVEVEGRGPMRMKHVQIGHRVRVENGSFAEVYSFGHYQPNARVEYIQILAETMNRHQPLEISSEHMMYVHKGKQTEITPARSVKVGDILLAGNGEWSPIVSIGKVTRQGAYSPLTGTGNLVVNGVLASNYISLTLLNTALTGKGLHWFQHGGVSLYRLFCVAKKEGCRGEQYDKTTGYNAWVQFWFVLEQWLLQTEMIQRCLVLGCVAPLILFANLVGMVLSMPSFTSLTAFLALVFGYAGSRWKLQKSPANGCKTVG